MQKRGEFSQVQVPLVLFNMSSHKVLGHDMKKPVSHNEEFIPFSFSLDYHLEKVSVWGKFVFRYCSLSYKPRESQPHAQGYLARHTDIDRYI